MDPNKTGFARVHELYEHRTARAEELKRQGKKIIGYLCSFAPTELLTAVDLVPFRILGDMSEPVTQADSYIESNLCPYVRNCFDLALKRKYSFVDGLVLPHSCDAVQRIYGIWQYYLPSAYAHFLNVPHTTSPSSLLFFREELESYKESLESFSGKEITARGLLDAIQLHNENRALVKDLYEFRKLGTPLVSGTEMMKLLVVGATIPATDFNTLLTEVHADVRTKRPVDRDRRPRVMVYGGIIDDARLIDLIEQAGADVVTDDFCMGLRSYANRVAPTPDPLDGLVDCYFKEFMCPRTDRGCERSRFDYLLKRASEFKVDGVIGYILKYCDSHGFDFPDVRDHLTSAGFPLLIIEDDYTLRNVGQLGTRIQAFVEMLDHTAPEDLMETRDHLKA